MCGINLIIDKKSQLDESFIQKMNASTKHRGPDATQFHKVKINQAIVYIGSNRLKIIDKSDQANQPFISQDGRYFLAYNGAIYNYKELRTELKKDFEFSTSSDTEVLMNCLIKFGMEGIKKLNGMFAFVFFDSLENKIYVARDSSGIKPAYYYQDESYFIVSSEIKGILSTGLIQKEFNRGQVKHYLKYRFAKKPETFFKNIFELEEGKVLEYKNAGFEISKINTNKNNYIEYSPEEISATVEGLLIKSVEKHLQSDFPVGIFLSGGVDSTLLLAITQELGIKKIPTFSIVNPSNEKSFGTQDFYYSKLAAEKYNSDHHQYEIDASVLKNIPDLISRLDQPIADTALLLTDLISKNSSLEIKVALTGAGADEVFAGYNRHKAYYNYLKYLKNNPSIINFLNKGQEFIPNFISFRKESRLLTKFSRQVHKDPITTYYNFLSMQGFDNLIIEDEIKNSSDNFFSNALHHDQHQYLISDVLSVTDKMSMQHGLEVRTPFLDTALLKFVNTVPSEQLIQKGRKWILKDLLKKRGGEKFTSRSKEGFGLPIGKWILQKEGEELLAYLKNKKNPIYQEVAYEKVMELLKLHVHNKKDFSAEIWATGLLAGWVEKEFKP